MTSKLYWNPVPLNAAIQRGFEVSLPRVAAEAQQAAPSSLAGAEIHQTGPATADLAPTGLGAIFEEGAKPHEIPAAKGYLYLKGSGAFVSVSVQHPGSPAKPYLGPAAARWASGGCQQSLGLAVRGSGFR